MNILMLSCRKATELMEKRLHVKLSTVEKAQLIMHTKVCVGCSEYQKQSTLIDSALHSEEAYHTTEGGNDSDALKSRIIDKLKEE